MYNRDLSNLDCCSSSVDALVQEAQNLSIDEKAELLERLLGTGSGLIVVSKSTNLPDYIIAQMSLLSSEGLAYVMRSFAE
jgi:hypothetical protein